MKHRFSQYSPIVFFFCALVQGLPPCHAEEGSSSVSETSVVSGAIQDDADTVPTEVLTHAATSTEVPEAKLGARALPRRSLVRAAGVSAALLICVGAVAALLKKFYGPGTTRPAARQSNLHVAGRVHLGGQVYATLLNVGDKDFLVVTGNRSNPGISVIHAGDQTFFTHGQQESPPEQAPTGGHVCKSMQVGHAA